MTEIEDAKRNRDFRLAATRSDDLTGMRAALCFELELAHSMELAADRGTPVTNNTRRQAVKSIADTRNAALSSFGERENRA
jgi:hypothetical protein